MRWFVCLIFWCNGLFAAFGQTPAALADSVENRLRLIAELSQSGNFERAQLEAEDFRWFVRRERLLVPVHALPLVSSVYRANKDEKSALRFFEEVELSARRERDVEKKAALLNALVREFEHWQMPEKALSCQRQLTAVQDSLASRRASLDALRLRRQLDSVQTLRQVEISTRGDVLEIERERALALAGIVALVFVALLAANFSTANRWRKRLTQKELELDIVRSVKSAAEILPPPAAIEERIAFDPLPVVAAPVEVAEQKTFRPFFAENEAPQTALIIEPNRQIVLYLKSLLSDQFEVETAQTATEGLHMASDLLPDLILCDAVLNGKTGIEVARQIKYSEKTSHIPIILLTEKSGNEGRLDALRAGAETWFIRPVLDVEMEAQIKNLLGIRRIKQQQFARALHLYFTENNLELDSPFLSQALRLIEQRLPDPDFTPDELARKMQLTNVHFHKKLRTLTGKDPAQLIREMRLEKAKMLLERRAAPVQTIAELVGFTSSGSFAMSFKDYFGENTLLLRG